MSIYEEEGKLTREDLLELRRRNHCQVCQGALDVFMDFDKDKTFLACRDWRRTQHEGIEREAPLPFEPNIPTRRKEMEQDYGEAKTRALDKYIDIGTMTKAIATQIVESLWGEAPVIEKTKAILLCQTYQLNPLMKHLYLIGYRRREGGKYILDEDGKPILDWSIQIGIGATRLMAQRKHNYSYLDLTPRKATDDEIRKILGDTADPDSIYGFVHIKDVDTGAEAFGLRGIKRDENIKGVEKGNTHLNMACVRAERLALDRQYPGEMPQGVEVIDERFIEADYKIIDKKTGEITEPEPSPAPEPKHKEHWCEEHNCAYEKKVRGTSSWWAHKLPDGSWCNEGKKKEVQPEPAEPVEEGKGFIDMDWLEESLKTLRDKKLQAWRESDLLTYIKTTYKVEAVTVLEGVAKLDKGQAAHFVKKVQDTLDIA